MVVDNDYVQAEEILKEYKLKTKEEDEPAPATLMTISQKISALFAFLMLPALELVLSNYFTRKNYNTRRNAAKKLKGESTKKSG